MTLTSDLLPMLSYNRAAPCPIHHQRFRETIHYEFQSLVELTHYMQPLQSEVVMCRERIESTIQEDLSTNNNYMTYSMGCRWSFVTRKKSKGAESLECQLKDSHTTYPDRVTKAEELISTVKKDNQVILK